MKTAKKLTALILALAMIFALAACAGNDDDQTSTGDVPKTTVNVATLMGPTGIGMTKLMDDDEKGSSANDYNFTVATSPDQIVAAISNATDPIDIAACPINLASTLYKKTNGAVQIAAINTLGVLYILENGNTINSISDLKGKTLYATGQGSTPEYILNYILEANGLTPGEDVTINYVAEHAELATMIATGKVDLAMLPEPNVTSARVQNSDLRIALDVTEEWGKATVLNGDGESELVQGCIIVRKEFAENNPEALEAFLEEYKASVDYVNANVDEASTLCETYGIIPKAAVAKMAIPNCNITFVKGAEMKELAQSNLQILFDANPSSIGGAMPADDFYYGC